MSNTIIKNYLPEIINKNFDPISEKLDMLEFQTNNKIDVNIDTDSELYHRINEIVRSFYDSFWDTSSLCLYYTYYLLRLKGNYDFDFEFKTLENKLYKDFYNYGIFATLREMRYFVEYFYYITNTREIPLDKFIEYELPVAPSLSPTLFTIHENTEYYEIKFEELISKISNYVGINSKIIIDIIKINLIDRYYNLHIIPIEVENAIDNKEMYISINTKFLYLVENNTNFFTNSKSTLKLATSIFENKNENCHWSVFMGGEPWASISKTLLNQDKFESKMAFVDTCWSLEHNTSIFINKIYNKNVKNDNNPPLKHYLNEIKIGYFGELYSCAKNYNLKLDRFTYRDIISANDYSLTTTYHNKHDK